MIQVAYFSNFYPGMDWRGLTFGQFNALLACIPYVKLLQSSPPPSSGDLLELDYRVGRIG